MQNSTLTAKTPSAHLLFPSWFLPLYTMISFSRIPYKEALERHHRQLRLLRRILGVTVSAALLLLVAWIVSSR